MKPNSGAQFEISIDGVPRTYRDRQDIALQTAQLLKSRNPNGVVKMRDLRASSAPCRTASIAEPRQWSIKTQSIHSIPRCSIPTP